MNLFGSDGIGWVALFGLAYVGFVGMLFAASRGWLDKNADKYPPE